MSGPPNPDETTPGRRVVRALLDTLCVDLGFCLDPESRAELEKFPTDDVGAFTRRVFEAERLDPSLVDRSLYRRVAETVESSLRVTSRTEGE